MRYSIMNERGEIVARAGTAQAAADAAGDWLKTHPGAEFAFSFDTTPHYIHPFTRWVRGDGAPVALIGTPYKTLANCLKGA